MTKMSLTELCRENPHIVCPMKCREVTVKKKRVETFRNIRYGDGRIYYYMTDSAAAVGPSVGLAQAHPNNEVKVENGHILELEGLSMGNRSAAFRANLRHEEQCPLIPSIPTFTRHGHNMYVYMYTCTCSLHVYLTTTTKLKVMARGSNVVPMQFGEHHVHVHVLYIHACTCTCILHIVHAILDRQHNVN